MFTDIKRDFIFALALAAAILGYGFCGDAQAQTTQPVYIRPSKGKVIEALKGVTSGTSPVFDMTAFSSVQVSVTYDGPGPCLAFVYLYGAPAASGPFSSVTVGDPNDVVTISFAQPIYNYTISGLPSFIKFQASTGAVTCGNLSLSFVPAPLPLRTEVSGYTPVNQPFSVTPQLWPVMTGGPDHGGVGDLTKMRAFGTAYDGSASLGLGTAIWADRRFVRQPALAGALVAVSNATVPVYTGGWGVRLENVDTGVALCAVGATSAPPTVSTTAYHFILKASTTTRDGTGGSIQLPVLGGGNNPLGVYCIRAAATDTTIAVLPQ